jgi:hypothetical protein
LSSGLTGNFCFLEDVVSVSPSFSAFLFFVDAGTCDKDAKGISGEELRFALGSFQLPCPFVDGSGLGVVPKGV